MTSMIERVARAIAPRSWALLDQQNDKLAHVSRRTASIRQARAAIEAMREPTEAMKIAGLGAGYDAAKPGLQRMEEAERAKGTDGWLAATVAVGNGAIYDAAYVAMIDEALKEQP